MAIQTTPTTNREIVESKLALHFSKEKSSPLVLNDFAGKSGAVTYSSIRKALKVSAPDLSGDAKTARVNELMNEATSQSMAVVVQLYRDGYNVTKVNGRELKDGTTRNISIAMTNRRDRSAKVAKKISDFTSAELLEMAAIKAEVEKAAANTIDV